MVASADQLIAGPLVRRVGLDQVSVWAVLSVHANVTLTIRSHPGAGSEEIGSATVPTVDVGKHLFFALITVRFPPGNRLLPDTRYAYDFEIGGFGLGSLGLLRDGQISVERSDGTTVTHHHLALGYQEGLLPTFLTPPSDPARLTISHGSCRRPYASGTDGLVALDQLIARTREPTADARRPHLLFLTGDQIYADDVSPELLEWMTDQANERIGKDADGRPIEGVRVEVHDYNEPSFTRQPPVRFPVDKYHFPIGRRQRLLTRAGGMSSDASWNHLLGFGEYVMHYVMSWCNVTWPGLTGADWTKLFLDRKLQVEAYLTHWRGTFLDGCAQAAARIAGGHDVPGAIGDQIPYVDAWRLIPPASRALDAHAPVDALEDWDTESDGGAWPEHWAPMPAPTPGLPHIMVPPGAPQLVGTTDDLLGLWKLHTPSWYAGREHFRITLDYKVEGAHTSANFPGVAEIEIRSDQVVNRLMQLRRFYEGLPYARRALANISTLMIFDDHEITDDWRVSQNWIDGIFDKKLGIDLVTNGMLAYALCQDWGNVPDRYVNDPQDPDANANAELLAIAQRMFQGNPAAGQAPSELDRDRLAHRCGLFSIDSPSIHAQWSYTIGDSTSPYEIIVMDSRTRRGYDTSDSPPANLSEEAINDQIAEHPPGQSAFTILVGSIPVLGFPPLEQIGQPFMNLMHDYQKNPKRTPHWRFGRFPEIRADYEFGPLIKDPEPWGFAPAQLEKLFKRLSTRQNVVILSGDVHYSISAKLTYWKRQAPQLVPATRIVQLTSSALQNQTGADEILLAHMALAQQFGAVVSGTFDRLGWAETIQAPQLPEPMSWQLRAVLNKNPVLVPTRMLSDAILQQVRSRTLDHPPQWAWRMELLKDLRHDDVRYGSIPRPLLMTQAELLAAPDLAFRTIANHHDWHTRSGVPRRFVMSSNLGVVTFQRAEHPAEAPRPGLPVPPADHLEVIHELYSWGRDNEPEGTSWPTVLRAAPYTVHRAALTPLDELPPDRELPT